MLADRKKYREKWRVCAGAWVGLVCLAIVLKPLNIARKDQKTLGGESGNARNVSICLKTSPIR